MTETATPLTFDAPLGPATAVCTICGSPIDRAYYTVNGQVACTSCRNSVANVLAQPPGVRGILTGIGLGSAAGFAGAMVWWAIRRFASLEIGLIAIGIGHFVGLGVRHGSGGRGGRGFQVLAVVLTYFWITANYVPDIIQAVVSHEGTAEPPSTAGFVLAVVVLFGYAMASPFLMGIGNVIGILIISFGLYQAWKLNTPAAVAVAGPFRLAPTSPAAPVAPPASAPGA